MIEKKILSEELHVTNAVTVLNIIYFMYLANTQKYFFWSSARLKMKNKINSKSQFFTWAYHLCIHAINMVLCSRIYKPYPIHVCLLNLASLFLLSRVPGWWMTNGIAFIMHLGQPCLCHTQLLKTGHYPDNKVHGANMGPIWGRQDPGGPCWTHELCYLGMCIWQQIKRNIIFIW